MTESTSTDVDDFIEVLGAGVFKEKLGFILSKAALGTVLHGHGQKKGKVTLEFTIQQIGENQQVVVSHKLAHVTPTKRGKAGEEDTSETPFFVGKGGKITIDPPREDSNGQFDLTGEKVTPFSK